MRKLALLLIITTVVLSVSSASVQKQRVLHAPDAIFFLTTNYTAIEATQSYALTLCLEDTIVDNTPAAILAAGAICEDSKRNSDGDSLNDDGKWHEYAMLAYTEIVKICKDGQGYELCKWYRSQELVNQ